MDTIWLQALPSHESLWNTVERVMQNQKLVHAYLLLGDLQTAVRPFVNRWIAMQLCVNATKPCGACIPCQRFIIGVHPDVYIVQPEDSSIIKIEQIRALSDMIYQTPQCGEYCFVVIEGAEKLNTSSANALLKLLEEPPAHVRFFLLAKELSRLPATLVSRCQRYRVPDSENSSIYLQIESQPEWMQDMQALLSGGINPWVLTEKWSKQSYPELIAWLYLVTAALFRAVRTGQSPNQWVKQLASTRSVETWLQQLDRIHEASKTLQRHIHLNVSLTLSYLLMGFCDVD